MRGNRAITCALFGEGSPRMLPLRACLISTSDTVKQGNHAAINRHNYTGGKSVMSLLKSATSYC
jgi:hypothetical protein